MANGMDNASLTFGSIVHKAEVLALLGIVEELWEHSGYVDPEGLSAVQRFYKQRRVELDAQFRSLEDTNPGMAAALHEQYEAARKVLGDDNC